MCVLSAFLLYMYCKPKKYFGFMPHYLLRSRLAPHGVSWLGFVESPVCYTIFTSRILGILAVSEIYIENFEEQVNIIDQMGVWISPDNFLLYSITLNLNFIIMSSIEPFGNKNMLRLYNLRG